MEALPIFLDRIVGPLAAVFISVSAVLIFGEIVPQALCSRYGLAIGSHMSPLVWCLIVLLFPLGYPLSKALDFFLGTQHGTFYRRAELKELIQLHEIGDQELGGTGGRDRRSDSGDGGKNGGRGGSDGSGKRGGGGGSSGGHSSLMSQAKQRKERERRHREAGLISPDEASIIKGALDLTGKTVHKCVTPLKDCFMLPLESKLNKRTMEQIREYGHSRIPVYRDGNRDNVVGMLLLKSLVGLDPRSAVPLSAVRLMQLSVVPSDLPLYDLLNAFRSGKSGHMALVAHFDNSDEILGVITLEDVIEELMQKDILDEIETGFYDETVDIVNSNPDGLPSSVSQNPRVARRRAAAATSRGEGKRGSSDDHDQSIVEPSIKLDE